MDQNNERNETDHFRFIRMFYSIDIVDCACARAAHKHTLIHYSHQYHSHSTNEI